MWLWSKLLSAAQEKWFLWILRENQALHPDRHSPSKRHLAQPRCCSPVKLGEKGALRNHLNWLLLLKNHLECFRVVFLRIWERSSDLEPVSSEFSGEEGSLSAGMWLLCTAPTAVVELQSIVALQKKTVLFCRHKDLFHPYPAGGL